MKRKKTSILYDYDKMVMTLVDYQQDFSNIGRMQCKGGGQDYQIFRRRKNITLYVTTEILRKDGVKQRENCKKFY